MYRLTLSYVKYFDDLPPRYPVVEYLVTLPLIPWLPTYLSVARFLLTPKILITPYFLYTLYRPPLSGNAARVLGALVHRWLFPPTYIHLVYSPCQFLSKQIPISHNRSSIFV